MPTRDSGIGDADIAGMGFQGIQYDLTHSRSLGTLATYGGTLTLPPSNPCPLANFPSILTCAIKTAGGTVVYRGWAQVGATPHTLEVYVTRPQE